MPTGQGFVPEGTPLGDDDPPVSSSRPTLGEEARALAQGRIVHGAMTAIAKYGLDATVDEIARAAGVSRRTVFRHFTTHDELVVAAIERCRSLLDARRPAPPQLNADVRTWLAQCAAAVHAVNGETAGPTLWDTQLERPNITAPVRAALEGLSTTRHRNAGQLASLAWSALGHDGPPPSWVVDAFALQLSSFASRAMAASGPAQAGQASARILMAVLAAARHDTARAPLPDSLL